MYEAIAGVNRYSEMAANGERTSHKAMWTRGLRSPIICFYQNPFEDIEKDLRRGLLSMSQLYSFTKIVLVSDETCTRDTFSSFLINVHRV